MNKPKYTIAVTGLNNIDSPGPGIAVIRALRDSELFDVRIIGLSYENLEPGIYMRDLVDKSYQIPYPSKGHELLLARLDYIHDKESLDLIIPNFDAELFGFIRMRDRLSEMGIRSFLPTEEQFEERIKGKLSEYGKRYGVNVPDSRQVFSVEGMVDEMNEMEFPVMVKGKFYEAYRALNVPQATSYFYKLAAKWGTPIVMQEFVQGDEFNVCALGDGEGGCIGAVAMRKTYITEQGKAWAGITVEDPDLIRMAQDIMRQTQWRGGMELELIKDEEGQVYLIEINPRFPAWVYLTAGAGQNQPEALVRMAMGEEVEPFESYEVGKLFIRYSYDMICDLKEFEAISTLGEL